jgi:hypothetical protein
MTFGIRRRPFSFPEALYTGAAIMAGATFLWWPMLLNGFPLIFHDTNSYVRMTPEIPRSYFYKLFVLFTGFKWSIWSTAAAQSLLSSGSIFLLCSLLGVERKRHFLPVMAALAIASSLPIFACFIMPDIFTGLMILLMFVSIFLFDRLSIPGRTLLFAMLLVAISAHLSHLVLSFGMICLSVGWIVVTRRRQLSGAVMALAACLTVAAAFTVYHGIKHHHYVLSAAGSTFFMANLIEYGPARRELQEFCPKSEYRLCAYQNQLPATANQFLWDTAGPFTTDLGAFDGMRAESSRLVLDTIKHRPLEVLSVSVGNSWRALLAVNPAVDIVSMDSSIPQLHRVFARIYGQQTVQQFDRSLQEHNRFPGRLAAAFSYAGLAVALGFIGWALTMRRHAIDRHIREFVTFSIVAYFANAAICGSLSGVFDRYQSRISWLIPLAALLMLFNWAGRRTLIASE